MGQVVLDSNNLDAIVKDATGEGLPSEKPAEASPAVVEAEIKPAPVVEDPDDVEGEDGLTPKQKREFTKSMQKTIARKHSALKEAEAFAAEQYNERRLAEQRADQNEREAQRLKTQLEGLKPVDPEEGKPKREDFETDEKFRDALDDWRVDRKFKARAAQEAREREEARQTEVMRVAQERIAHAMELVPDFQEVTEAVDLEVPPVIAGYMQESEMFAELGYHFAQHPDELKRLQTMSPARALVEVGKIESKLSPFAPAPAAGDGTKTNGTEPKSETESTPPETAATRRSAGPSHETGSPPAGPSKPRAPVIKPLSSSSATQVEKDEREMSSREVTSTWQKRRGVNLERRKRH